MKKKYLVPETEVTLVTIETNILSNGQDLNCTIYGDRGDDDDNAGSFWN